MPRAALDDSELDSRPAVNPRRAVCPDAKYDIDLTAAYAPSAREIHGRLSPWKCQPWSSK
jgi:hypothetical protein